MVSFFLILEEYFHWKKQLWVDNFFFSFSILKMLFYCLPVCIVSEKKAVTLKMICALFLWMLSRFSFYLSFLAVWLWRAHVCILVIFQFCFEFTEDQDAFLKSWEISSRYSFEYCFCLVLSFPPGTPRTCILECFIFSHRSMSFCSLKTFFSSVLQIG